MGSDYCFTFGTTLQDSFTCIGYENVELDIGKVDISIGKDFIYISTNTYFICNTTMA